MKSNGTARLQRLAWFSAYVDTLFDWLQVHAVTPLSPSAPRTWQSRSGETVTVETTPAGSILTVRGDFEANRLVYVASIGNEIGEIPLARLMLTREARTGGCIAAAWLNDNDDVPEDATLVLVAMTLAPEKTLDTDVIFASAFVAGTAEDRRAWLQWIGREQASGHAARELVTRIAAAALSGSIDGLVDLPLAASSGSAAPPGPPSLIAPVEIDDVTFEFVEASPGSVRIVGPIPHDASALLIGPMVARLAQRDSAGADLEGVGTMDLLAAMRSEPPISWERK